ncbi:uncharacterized protein LOC126746969 [Anthonomus grandis grandis]|uniref:uncharacterized protein LOC126746969 n=1 Tax=Anthonomus grandis grandis TaxID=2921223 RepID=UPI002165FE99|nr:uncharacterized protein LOC126746969 [Anthonomus grandis grandis]
MSKIQSVIENNAEVMPKFNKYRIKMSNNPVLSAKQQKGTLAAKKTKTKETIRNVLVAPYIKYWPLICQGVDYEHLISILGSYLEMTRPSMSIRIPWKELRKVPKAERKALKMPPEYAGIIDKIPEGEKTFIIGVNDINKTLQKYPNTIKAILITSDVQPPLMVEHLIDQSVLHHIPVLIIQSLRKLLKEKHGLGSIAIALTDNPQNTSLLNIIGEIYQYFPVSENHINYKRAFAKSCDTISVENDNNNNNNELELESEKLHLCRNGAGKRCFIPGQSQKVEKNLQVDSIDFLAFSETRDKPHDICLTVEDDEIIVIPDTPMAKKCSEKRKLNSSPLPKAYKSLSVKKIKGNTNRNKRKIDDMKNRVKKKTKKRSK